MVEKFKLYAVGNETLFSYYVLDKNRRVVEFFHKNFNEIFNIKYPLMNESCDEKILDRHPEKLKDIHEKVGGIKTKTPLRIDIFYGYKRIYLTIYAPFDLRSKFNDKLKSAAKIIKPVLRIKKK